jgi:phospholipase A1
MKATPPALALCAFLFTAVVGAAFGQARPVTPADCHGIASGPGRLACYDAVSGRAADGAKEAPSTAASASSGTAAAAASSETVVAPRSASKSMIDTAWGLDPSSDRYVISFYRENYLLFGRYTDRVNTAPYDPIFEAIGQPPVDINSTEAKFQLSFKGRLMTTDDRRWSLWAAYTQQSHWQLYNGEVSRPFRETNFMPELFATYRPDVDLGGGFRWALLNAGYNHQSNGRTDVISRSWDRIFAEVGVERDNLVLSAKLWYRLPEKSDQDDNPDITRYYGHGELGALYRWRGNSFSAALRGNVSTGKGAVQLGWTSPPILGPLRGYVQVFSGYGESMVDYNWKQTTIGAGIALSDGL